MIRIELTGSYSARAGAIAIDRESARRGSPICDLARLLIAKGRNPDELCTVWRGNTMSFGPREIGRWAEKYVAEPDGGTRSARMKNWRPAPVAA